MKMDDHPSRLGDHGRYVAQEHESTMTWIHRFQTYNDNNLDALAKGELWFSSVERFNDPFEFVLLNDSDLFGHQGSLFGGGQRDRDFWLRNLKTHGVCCFTIAPESGPDNQLVWAHYGNEHKGYAIGMNTDDLVVPLGHPIKYDLQPHVWDDSRVLAAVEQLDKVKESILEVHNIIFRKHECWSVEHEYRIVNDRPNTRGLQPWQEKWPFKKIYFGARMPGEEKEAIREITKNSMEYFDTILSVESYTMTFVPSGFQTENSDLVTSPN